MKKVDHVSEYKKRKEKTKKIFEKLKETKGNQELYHKIMGLKVEETKEE